MSAEYYLQDIRQYVGNCMVFWRRGRSGYTTDLSDAEVFTAEAAFHQNSIRPEDVPRKKGEMDALAKPRVDFQDVP